MTLSAILSALLGFFKFFHEVQAFIHYLEKAPEEKKQEMMERIKAEQDAFESTGRP